MQRETELTHPVGEVWADFRSKIGSKELERAARAQSLGYHMMLQDLFEAEGGCGWGGANLLFSTTE